MRNLRMRLARLIAPGAILADPFPDARGLLIIRDGAAQATFKVAEVTVTTPPTTRELLERDFNDPQWFKPLVREFHGTIA